MSGFSTTGSVYDHLSRSSLWTNQLKDVLLDNLMGFNWVRMIGSEFPDGDTFNIPSSGQMTATDYAEGQPVQYSAFDSGNFQFTITEYKQVGTYIYNKFKQDSYYMSQVESSFVPKMARAIAVAMERDIFKAPTPAGAGQGGGQTTADTNEINNARHRMIGSGTSETISIDDFRWAAYALEKANVPLSNLVAVVDPSVTFALGSQPNLLNFSNNPMWEGVVTTGLTDGMRFFKNIWGFDVYESRHLHVNTASEQISGVTAAAGVNNLFFSAAGGDLLPIVGQVRQPPKVDSEYNKDYQRDEYVTTARWGYKLYRPENMVIVVTDTDQVYA